MDDANQVTVVTGAASGMGRALCSRLAARDQPTVAVDVDTERLHWVDDFPSIAACGHSWVKPTAGGEVA